MICKWCQTELVEVDNPIRREVRHRRGVQCAGRPTCSLCDGEGCEEGCGRRGGCQDAYSGPDSHKVCPRCGGTGDQRIPMHYFFLLFRHGTGGTITVTWPSDQRDVTG